jgi:hypothetical protein
MAGNKKKKKYFFIVCLIKTNFLGFLAGLIFFFPANVSFKNKYITKDSKIGHYAA